MLVRTVILLLDVRSTRAKGCSVSCEAVSLDLVQSSYLLGLDSKCSLKMYLLTVPKPESKLKT